MKLTDKPQAITLFVKEEHWLDGMPSKIMYNDQCTPLIANQYIQYCYHYLYAQEDKEICANGNSSSQFKLEIEKNCVKEDPTKHGKERSFFGLIDKLWS